MLTQKNAWIAVAVVALFTGLPMLTAAHAMGDGSTMPTQRPLAGKIKAKIAAKKEAKAEAAAAAAAAQTDATATTDDTDPSGD